MRFTAAISLLVSVSAFACGTPASSGGWEGVAIDAGPTHFDFDAAYPTADPDDASLNARGPTFGTIDASAARGCEGKAGPKGDRTLTLASGGLTRIYYLHVPSSYDAAKGTMLVFNFHGFSSNAPEQRLLSEMDSSSDKHGYIAVYPEGIASSWNAGDCCGDAWNNSVDDIAFTKAMLSKIEQDYCIDSSHIHATGFSNGGFFSYRLACEMADTFASLSAIAGQEGIAPELCAPSRPMPILDFHGTSDPVVPYNGGTPIIPVNLGGFVDFRSSAETISIWRKNNSCLGIGKTVYQAGDATCTLYDTCAQNADVTHCAIAGGGHTWPGGIPVPALGATSSDIGATETSYQFFVAHAM